MMFNLGVGTYTALYGSPLVGNGSVARQRVRLLDSFV